MASLEAIAGDATAGAVKKNKAANEVKQCACCHCFIFFFVFFQLAQMKSEDPLPLRRAKITQEVSQ